MMTESVIHVEPSQGDYCMLNSDRCTCIWFVMGEADKSKVTREYLEREWTYEKETGQIVIKRVHRNGCNCDVPDMGPVNKGMMHRVSNARVAWLKLCEEVA